MPWKDPLLLMGCEDVRRQLSVRQTALVQPNTTQDYFSSVGYLDTFAACVGLCLGQPRICQYEHPTKEDSIRM